MGRLEEYEDDNKVRGQTFKSWSPDNDQVPSYDGKRFVQSDHYEAFSKDNIRWTI